MTVPCEFVTIRLVLSVASQTVINGPFLFQARKCFIFISNIFIATCNLSMHPWESFISLGILNVASNCDTQNCERWCILEKLKIRWNIIRNVEILEIRPEESILYWEFKLLKILKYDVAGLRISSFSKIKYFITPVFQIFTI